MLLNPAPEAARWPETFPPPFADAWGDDRYGLWAEFVIVTARGSATQRMRWIEPGTFRMGSPDNEPERLNNEGPQHLVTLTRGFWLADTACTQGLWQAVTGGNPSQFKDDPQNPVEQVSWNDVQAFLRSLEALLPGVEACLPSEAQWEYACRAGTEIAYHFGNDITSERANYGNSTKKTVPVKSLPANDWGLYEMHGNVWEWCADGRRPYDEAPQQDPEGPADSAQRAVRGGSWIFGAWLARSAHRGAHVPGGADDFFDDLGFRLCLRSRAR